MAKYGYLAVLLGTMLEGETVVLAAGFLAHQGYLSIPWIVFFAVTGSTISDQGLFFLSRFKGAAFLGRFPKIADKARAMAEKMRSRPATLTAFALFFRFLYGLRNIAPVFLGMSAIPTLRFVALNAVGAVLWATVFSIAGYAFAKAFSAFMGTLAKVEGLLLLSLVVGSAAFFAYRRWRRAKEFDFSPGGSKGDREPGADDRPKDA